MRAKGPLSNRAIWGACVLLAAIVPLPAFAVSCGTIVNPLSVSATPTNFGVYDPVSSAPTDANGTVTIACDLSADVLPAFSVSLSSGSGSYSARTMRSGSASLSYDLYTTASHTTVWGDGTSGTATQSGDGILVLDSVSLTVYGRVPAGQYVDAGSYADTIIVSVEY